MVLAASTRCVLNVSFCRFQSYKPSLACRLGQGRVSLRLPCPAMRCQVTRRGLTGRSFTCLLLHWRDNTVLVQLRLGVVELKLCVCCKGKCSIGVGSGCQSCNGALITYTDKQALDGFRYFVNHCQYANLNNTLKNYLHSLDTPFPEVVMAKVKILPPSNNPNESLRSVIWPLFRTLSREVRVRQPHFNLIDTFFELLRTLIRLERLTFMRSTWEK